MSDCHIPTVFDSALEKALPLSMHWDLTWRCDHQCVHCYLIERRQKELNYEEACLLLDQLAQTGVMMLLISGGDPFLRKDALSIIQYARQQRFDVKINTHGNFIDEKMADALAIAKVSQVNISLYSIFDHEHEAITLIKGSHALSIKAAELLCERGIKVHLKTPVMVHNQTGWRGVKEIAERIGAHWEVDGHIVPDDQSDFGLCKIGVDPSDRVLATLAAMEDHRQHAVLPHLLPKTESQQRTCSAGTVSGYIAPDGGIYPCVNWREKMGDIRDSHFANIWYDSSVAKQQRHIRRASYLKDCQGCTFHHQCNYCPGLSYAETGDASSRSAYVCERTHITMSAIEHLIRLNEAGKAIPQPNTPEADDLFDQLPTFADRQWAARSAGLARPADQLKAHDLIQIEESQKVR
jgi:AdoMet-dependent heme synthase